MKLNLANILSGFNITRINNNFTAIENELQNKVLYRDNPVGEPNMMENVLDMNSNQIINLPTPSAPNNAARLQDVVNAIAGIVPASAVPFTPVGGISSTNVQAAIAELVSSSGSSLIGFLQSGVAPVARSVQDKLREGYVSPEDFDTVGLVSGGDWSDPLQKALDVGKNVWLTPGKIYGITREMSAGIANITITGGGIIKLLPGYVHVENTLSALAVSAPNIKIEAVTFEGSGAVAGSLNNRFIWCTSSGMKVTSAAQFQNLPPGGTNFNGAIGCNGAAAYTSVIGAYFLNNPGSIFFQGRNCEASFNRIINPRDASIAMNGTNCSGCVINGNTIDNEAGNSITSMIAAEEGASSWVITNNRLKGIKDGTGITALNLAVLTTVKGGVIANNVIDGNSLVTVNPCAGINVSQYYNDVEVSGNVIYNMPTGNSNTRAIIVAATGGSVIKNNVDVVSGTVGVILQIAAGARGLSVQNNTFRQVVNSQRHVLFVGGTYTGNPVHFVGGKFYGGSEGINAELNTGNIVGLSMKIDNIEDQTVQGGNILVAATLFGDRCAYMAAGAWARPHRIGIFTEMHMSGGSGAPATSGTVSFQNGDKFYYLAPTASAFIGVTRAAGAFKTFGATSA